MTADAPSGAPVPSPDADRPSTENPVVGIIMGSKSDLKIMSAAADILRQFGVPYEITLVSPHRTPHRMVEYAESARKRGLRVLIAGGGGAAHLPGMVAAFTTLPVIGVPINSTLSIQGLDSILSMIQMPAGTPVATVGLDNADQRGHPGHSDAGHRQCPASRCAGEIPHYPQGPSDADD